jgi:hypothetical protein
MLELTITLTATAEYTSALIVSEVHLGIDL